MINYLNLNRGCFHEDLTTVENFALSILARSDSLLTFNFFTLGNFHEDFLNMFENCLLPSERRFPIPVEVLPRGMSDFD